MTVPARVAVVAGDAREWFAACLLHRRGYDVVYVGAAPARGVCWPQAAPMRRDEAEALTGRDALLAAARGLPAALEQRLAGRLERMRRGGVVLVGRPGSDFAAAADRCGLRVVDLLRHDAFARLNAVPTAEGALAEALSAGDRTIWNSSCFVLGYGRVGSTLAARARALGARVTVFARRAGQRAHARAAGCGAEPLQSLPARAGGADFVFNSIPAPVLSARAVQGLRPDAVLVDLASPPGGCDQEAIAARGLRFRWPLGIPGRLAPRTAGCILADVVAESLGSAQASSPSAASARE